MLHARHRDQIPSRDASGERCRVALLQSTFFDICTVISARSVKVHYNLSRGNYRLNKQAAVEWVETPEPHRWGKKKSMVNEWSHSQTLPVRNGVSDQTRRGGACV